MLAGSRPENPWPLDSQVNRNELGATDRLYSGTDVHASRPAQTRNHPNHDETHTPTRVHTSLMRSYLYPHILIFEGSIISLYSHEANMPYQRLIYCV